MNAAKTLWFGIFFAICLAFCVGFVTGSTSARLNRRDSDAASAALTLRYSCNDKGSTIKCDPESIAVEAYRFADAMAGARE